MSALEAIIRRNVQKAAGGDAKAFSTLIALAREYGAFSPEPAKCLVVKFVAPDGSHIPREDLREFQEWKTHREEFRTWSASAQRSVPRADALK
jgi:hypothetical protein